MIEFLNPFLFGGLAAISVPVIIHLWHRRKIKSVDWGGMRFLVELLAQRRRRLFLEELVLLLLRVLILVCVAMALVRPALHRLEGGGNGHGLARQGRTAAVLLVDDSVSSGAGRAQPAMESMKKLAAAYLDSLAPGDEASLLLMSRLSAPAGDPIFDLEELRARVAGVKPSFAATDIPALLDAGLVQLKRHINPGAELVLLTDGRKDGWHEEDKGRWEEVRARLRGNKTAATGSRSRPRVIVLSPDSVAASENVAIVGISADQALVSAGREVAFRVTTAYYGRQENRDLTVQLSIDGRAIESKIVRIPQGGQQDAVFTHTFTAVGSHSIEAALLNSQDLLAADDRRALSIQVEASVPVLLVDGATAQGLENKLGFLAYALDPGLDGRGAFKVTRIPVAQFSAPRLPEYRVVVLGDVAVLEPAMVDALERFVVGGGGILVGLGPNSDRALINRYWARDGEGFLPCPLESPQTLAEPAIPAGINLAHPVFSGFGSRSDEAWRAAKVRSFFKLNTRAVKSGDLEILVSLEGGEPIVVERRRGLGLVALVATSLNADWGELPLQAAYVPLMRGLVGHLGSFVMPPRNLAVGDSIVYPLAEKPARGIEAEDPEGRPMKVSLGAWEGRDAALSEPLTEPGVYLLRDPQVSGAIRYAVTVVPAESALAASSDREMTGFFDESPSIMHSPEQVAANLDPNRRESVELWPWLLLGAASLMFAEGWLTRREARAS